MLAVSIAISGTPCHLAGSFNLVGRRTFKNFDTGLEAGDSYLGPNSGPSGAEVVATVEKGLETLLYWERTLKKLPFPVWSMCGPPTQ
jgi:hypothetical protein